MRIVMIGAGYVGLVSGACFADFGFEVTCIDKDEGKIDRLRQNVLPIYEPGLAEMVRANVAAGRLAFASDAARAVPEADVVFLAVGTPSRRGDGHADLSHVYAAAEELGRLMTGYTVIVTKSTVPVGTGDEVEEIIRRVSPDADFDVVSNPEFLREGSAIGDFKRPDRIVVGTGSRRAEAAMRTLYGPLVDAGSPILVTGRRTAELTKYAANAFLAAKITFINEIADLCEKVDADVVDIAHGIGLDRRIGPKFLDAGPGFGGSCFPKDTLALARTANIAGAPLSLVDALIESNHRRKQRMAEIVVDAAGGSVGGKTVAVLGLTFKPDTDDMRDAPSLTIVPALQAAGATIRAFDPQGEAEARKVLQNVEFAQSVEACLTGADIALVVTEWAEFRSLDLKRLASLLGDRLLVDLRNIYDLGEAARAGLRYRPIGRPQPAAHDAPWHLGVRSASALEETLAASLPEHN